MTWTETLRTAWEALNGRRMRSLLTMLGILIGIAAVMLTVGLGEGARLQIGKEINKLGSNLLIVMPGGSGGLSSGLGLSLAKQIIVSAGGQLWYEDREGGGARFVIELPDAGAA